MTDPGDVLERRLELALACMDRRGYKPAPPHTPWAVWRTTVAGRP